MTRSLKQAFALPTGGLVIFKSIIEILNIYLYV